MKGEQARAKQEVEAAGGSTGATANMQDKHKQSEAEGKTETMASRTKLVPGTSEITGQNMCIFLKAVFLSHFGILVRKTKKEILQLTHVSHLSSHYPICLLVLSIRLDKNKCWLHKNRNLSCSLTASPSHLKCCLARGKNPRITAKSKEGNILPVQVPFLSRDNGDFLQSH